MEELTKVRFSLERLGIVPIVKELVFQEVLVHMTFERDDGI